MALINYSSREITLKIVYYGAGLSGKTTNLQRLHTGFPQARKGKLISLSTEADRTLFFDLMPLTYGKISDFTVRFQLYTVPGQVRYNSTRKLLLKGCDAVVFVADSQSQMREFNIDSWRNMRENLMENGLNPDSIPIVLQYNKRDLSDILSVEELDLDLNPSGRFTVNAEAVNDIGVKETFNLITRLLLKDISKKHGLALATEAAEMPSIVSPVGPERIPAPGLPATEMPETEGITLIEPAAEEVQDYGYQPPPDNLQEAPQEAPLEEMEKWDISAGGAAIPTTTHPFDKEGSEGGYDESVALAIAGLVYEIKESKAQLDRVIIALEKLEKAISKGGS